MAEKPPLYTVTDRRKFTTDGALREGRPAESEPTPTAKAPSESFATPETASTTGGPGLHLIGAQGKVEDARTDRQEDNSHATQSRPASSAGTAEPVRPSTQGETARQPEDFAADDEGQEDDGLGPSPTAAETAQQDEDYRRSSNLIDTMVKQQNPGAPPSIQMDFEQLVQSIYLAAVVAMGAGGEPGQKPRIDIIGARQSIDMLAVHGDKTTGNLSDQEQRLLQTALFNLRMMFLEITNALAAQAQRPPAIVQPGSRPPGPRPPGPKPPGPRR